MAFANDGPVDYYDAAPADAREVRSLSIRDTSAAADAAGTSARVRVQVRSFDAMCRMVACGLGLAVLPKAAAGLYSRALGIQIVALDGLQVARNLLLVMRRRSELSVAAAALVSLIESDLASRASAGAASW